MVEVDIQMVINLDKLDKRKTYIVLEFGTSAIARTIQRLTRDYCPEERKLPSHVLALVYENKCWNVYESHMKPEKDYGIHSGVRTYPYKIFKEAFPEIVERGRVFYCKLKKKQLKKYLGQPYGVGDIVALLRAAIHHNNGKQKDRKGIICSEYLALACAPIRRYFNLPAWCITPAHWLAFLTRNNYQEII